MAADRSYIAHNNAERERLRALVDRLSDQDLSRPLNAGWTIASVLAHLAFWDQRLLVLIERWEGGGPGSEPHAINPGDIDWINNAAKVLCLALAPRAAAQLAIASAQAVDRKVETLSADLVAANAAAGNPINLLRAQHRREHLDEVERALTG